MLAVILFNNNPWKYHLWYLQAFLYVLLITFVINKHGLWKWIYRTTPILLTTAIVLGKYSEPVCGNTFYNFLSRNFLLIGLPCYAIGHYIRTSKIHERKEIKSKLIVLLIICLILAYAESLIEIAGYGDLFITTIPLSFLILICTLNYELHQEGCFSRAGRHDSLYIYILHPLVADILFSVSSSYGIKLTPFRHILPLIVFLFTIALSKSSKTFEHDSLII